MMDNLVFEDKTGQPEFLEGNVSEVFPAQSFDCKEEPLCSPAVAKANIIDKIFSKFETQIADKKKNKKSKKVEDDVNVFDDVYFDSIHERTTTSKVCSSTTKVDDLMRKSVITPEFEKLHAVPPYEVSQQLAKKQRREEREKTKGSNWFNLPAPEMTSELKKDLEILQMRSVLDPKHFYKKNVMKTLPKYFQVGRIIEAPADFYHSRVPKKERKKTIVEELMADAEFKKYNKRKYTEIIEEKSKTCYKAHKHAKRLKNRKK